MKSRWFIIGSLFLLVSINSYAGSYLPEQLKQFKETNCCPDCDLSQVILLGNYTSANLSGAILTQSSLSSSTFATSDFTGANLQGANLTNACLVRAKINQAQLNSVKSLSCAIMPDGTQHPADSGKEC